MTPQTIVIRGKEFVPEAGSHQPDGHACVMEMAAYMANEPWSDAPKCASPVIGAFCRSFWDSSEDNWPGLIERLDRIAGSANPAADDARAWLATDWLVRVFTPMWLRKAALDAEADAITAMPALTSTALAREAQPIIEAARAKADAAWAGARAGAWAADAAWDAARAAAWAADAAWDAARDAAWAAAWAAARDAAWAAARDAASKEKGYTNQYNAARKVLDAALAETVTELRASAFDLLDRMLLQGTEVEA